MAYKGYLPKNITYVCSSPQTEETYFDDDDSVAISSHKVTPTFVVEDGKSLDSAIRWSGLKKPRTVTLPNEPIKNVKVLNLETRGNGGRAYKVLLNDKFYVDMREDVLLDTMISVGVNEGGILKGEYVWAKYGAQMKLVRCGSGLHKQFVKGTEINESKEISRKDLRVGGIYLNKKGEPYMYLGDYYTYQLKYEEGSWRTNDYGKTYNERLVKIKPMLFKRIWSFDYPKDNYKTCDINHHFKKEQKGFYDTVEFKTSFPKFYKEEAFYDLSEIDIVNYVRERGESYDKHQKYTQLVSMSIENICLGKTEPFLHPMVEKLPIVKK